MKSHKLALTREELECLNNSIIVNMHIIDEVERLIKLKGNEKYIIELNDEEIEELSDNIASEANHAEEKKKQEILDCIYTKLDNLIKYNKQEPDFNDKIESVAKGKISFSDVIFEHIQDIENNDFLHDFKVFLGYVAENNIQLTLKRNMIPRKHLYAINPLFKHPHPMEQKIGSKIFKVREEFELRYLYFIDILSVASEYVKVTHTDYLRKGRNFTKFFELNGLSQISQLFLGWYLVMSWETWFMRGGDFAERLQDKVKEIAEYLAMVKNSEKIYFIEFANNLIAKTNVKWICLSGDKDLSHARFGVRELLITPMEYFGAVELFTEKSEWGYDKLVSFKFTNPLGRYLINLLTHKKYDPKLN